MSFELEFPTAMSGSRSPSRSETATESGPSCAPNPFAGDLARELVQIQRDGEPLLAGHLAIALDLLVQCGRRSHDVWIIQFLSAENRFLQSGNAD